MTVKLRPSTFSASLNKLLRPLLTGAKREAEIVAAPRVKGKVISLNHGEGTRILIVEQKGADIWRGGAKSVAAAIEQGVAGIGVDSVVLQRAQRLEIPIVAVVIEELNQLCMAPIESFFASDGVRTRANFNGRAIRILDYERLQHKFLKPPLRKRKPRDIE